MKAVKAVIATMIVEVPTATRIGTPHARTINGILKDPPDMPTIPGANPVKLVTGSVSHRFTTYLYSPKLRCQ